MVLPIYAFGHPVLKKVAQDIDKDYDNIIQLIANMYETMEAAVGVGLAAPQIGKSIRLFVIDASPYAEEYPETQDFRKIFINVRILEEYGEEWAFKEGCLSVPLVNEDVFRHENIRIEYYDENFVKHEEEFSGMLARIIQHEYDHLEGKVFVEKVSQIRKVLLRKKLIDISKGNIEMKYRMVFPLLKKKK